MYIEVINCASKPLNTRKIHRTVTTTHGRPTNSKRNVPPCFDSIASFFLFENLNQVVQSLPSLTFQDRTYEMLHKCFLRSQRNFDILVMTFPHFENGSEAMNGTAFTHIL